MCKYSDDTGYKCLHENLEDNDYCIFHLQDDNKDVDEFNKGIKEILETEEDSINFHGFYFPPDSSDFSEQNFKKKINFSNVTFSEEAHFQRTTFSENAIFVFTKFSGHTSFEGANFSGDAIFNRTEFSEKADFRRARFSESAKFVNTIFKTSDFSDATFLKDADFRYSTFSGKADFRYSRFSGYTMFSITNFKTSDFRYASFLKHANFHRAKFSGKADFIDTTFPKNADFVDARFPGNTDFTDAEFFGRFVFIPAKSETFFFQNTHFSDNIRIKADLSKCYFANSNIERVDMTDSSWVRDDDKPKKSFSAFYEWIKNKGLSDTSIKIWEEFQGDLSSNWKELEGIYRRLKQSYQKFGDNSTAGKFYFQEMECKRKQLKGIEKHFWHLFYKKLCGYGEKPFNVIWASLFLIFVSAFLYLFGGIEFVGSSILKVPPNVIDYNLSLNSFGFQWAITNIDSVLEDVLLCLYTSVITFTTLGYGDVHPIGFSRVVASVEAGFGIIMTALFIFVFTRKMLR